MEQLRLRLAEQKDAEQLVVLEQEAADYRFEAELPPDGLPAELHLTRIREKIGEPGITNGLYVIETAEQRLVASFSLGHAFARNGFATLQFAIQQQDRERYGQAAVQLAADYCFHEFNLIKLNMQVKGSEETAAAFFYQAGFRRELCLREHYYRKGNYETVYQLGLLRGDGAGADRVGAETGGSANTGVTVGKFEQTLGKGGHAEQFVPTGQVGQNKEATVSRDEDHLLRSTMPPTKRLLIGEGVDLTPVTAADAEKLYEANLTSDDKQYAVLSAAAPLERQGFIQRNGRLNDLATFKEPISFGIKKKDGEIIGTIGANFIDNRNRNVMLGLGIAAPQERGKGYGREAIELFVDFAFLEMNMHRVYLGCFAFNEKAARLYERIGFRPEGVNRVFVYRNGNYYDELAFGVTKKEWLTQRGYL
jgi:RimJ/RimL family protein N-acetyltransferase